MANSASPRMILGIQYSFCSSVPILMSAGTTEVIVRVSGGPPHRLSSLMKIVCSTVDSPLPPYSLGQKILSQPDSASFFRKALECGP